MTDHHKFQFIMKKAFNLVSTFKNTSWYNETNSASKKNTNIEDINIQESPSVPRWETDISDNYTDLSFGSGNVTGIHTILEDYSYSDDKALSAGVHLDSTATVALFVRLKLDKIDDHDICSNAYAYTVYDSSDNLLLETGYEFNYNSQINVGGIDVFKPYNYKLEYSSDGNTFVSLANSDGNWIFDNKTGIITFEENPAANLDSTDLYFTFVKYLGVQGLQNLLYYKNGKVGINVSDPQSELDISGSVSITGNLDICGNLDVDTDVLYIDSTAQRVGVNTDTPRTTLDVSGSVYIDGSLNISSSIGPGFYPIGAIIMWPTNSFPSDAYRNGFGTWLLCNGQPCSDYTTLMSVIGGSTVPDFSNRYVKSSSNNSIRQVDGGTSTFSLDISNLPQHTHDSEHHHGIDISGQDHHHDLATHNHNTSIGDHYHSTDDHTHDISDNGHTHTCNYNHAHTLTEGQHYHKWQGNHTHGVTGATHPHPYEKAEVTASNGGGVGGQQGSNRWKNMNNTDTDTDTGTYSDDEFNPANEALSISDVSLNAVGLTFLNDTGTTASGQSDISGQLSTGLSTSVADTTASTDVSSNINIGDSLLSDISSASSGVSMSNSMVGYDYASASNKMSSSTSTDWTNTKQDLQINVEPECKTAYFFIRAE